MIGLKKFLYEVQCNRFEAGYIMRAELFMVFFLIF